ncbi:MAG: hypothetical protein DRG83_17545, partial [Deltaproteobacteria bacterium]
KRANVNLVGAVVNAIHLQKHYGYYYPYKYYGYHDEKEKKRQKKQSFLGRLFKRLRVNSYLFVELHSI